MIKIVGYGVQCFFSKDEMSNPHKDKRLKNEMFNDCVLHKFLKR